MADTSAARSPLPSPSARIGAVVLADESGAPIWRTWHDTHDVSIGRTMRVDGDLVLAVSPNEWIVIGERPEPEAVDITHVRATIRLTGPDARKLLAHVCALDLNDLMTPDGSAARTLVAGVATELVREDIDDAPAYLLLVSRSFAEWVWDRLSDVAERLE